jgi:hypothetical protein
MKLAHTAHRARGAARLFLLAASLSTAAGCAASAPAVHGGAGRMPAPGAEAAPQLVIENRGLTTARVEFVRAGAVVYRTRVMPHERVAMRYPPILSGATSPRIVVQTLDGARPFVVEPPHLEAGDRWELMIERELPLSTLLPLRRGGD